MSSLKSVPRPMLVVSTPSTPLPIPPGAALLSDPVSFVEPSELLGRLWYRWQPAADRGPLRWPPSPPEPPLLSETQ